MADKGNSRVQLFDTAGRFRAIIGTSILAQPAAIALDSSNNCFVADVQSNAIFAFSPAIGDTPEKGCPQLPYRPSATRIR